MQLSWLWRGLRTGVLTTPYPRRSESMPAEWGGTAILDATRCRVERDAPPCVEACLPGALRAGPRGGDGVAALTLDSLACIACGRCVAACPQDALSMSPTFELARRGHPHAESSENGP